MSIQRCVNIIVVGNHEVGKTDFLEKFMDFQYELKSDTKIRLPYYRRIVKCKKDETFELVCINLYEVTGLHKFHSLPAEYYHNSMGFLIMFDVTNQESLFDIPKWYNEIKLHSKDKMPPTILCGNKNDLTPRYVVPSNISTLFNNIWREASSVTGENVTETVNFLIFQMITKMGYTEYHTSIAEPLSGECDRNCCCML